MSDSVPPGETPDGTVVPEPPPEPHGFAALPLWARILIPSVGVVVVGLIGYLLWQAVQGDEEVGTIEDVLEELADEEQTATPTIPPPVTSAPVQTSTASTEAAAVVTTEPTSTTSSTTTTTTTTVVPTTTSTTSTTSTSTTSTTTTTTTTTVPRPTTTVPRTTTTVARPTTTRAPTTTTTVAPTTTLPPTTTTSTTTTTTTLPPTTTTTTLPPTTEPPAPTTLPPPTTTPPTTVAPGPTIPVAPGQIAPNARGFAESWNINAAGTGVPTLTESEITALENGPAATTFIAPLSDQVGLVGVVRNDDSSVAEVLLVWIPGGDEAASNQLYRDAFDVLLQTVNPELTPDERAGLIDDLGLTAQAPPFPTNEAIAAEAFPDRFARFVRDTSAANDTAIISVVDARPR